MKLLAHCLQALLPPVPGDASFFFKSSCFSATSQAVSCVLPGWSAMIFLKSLYALATPIARFGCCTRTHRCRKYTSRHWRLPQLQK